MRATHGFSIVGVIFVAFHQGADELRGDSLYLLEYILCKINTHSGNLHSGFVLISIDC